MFPATLTTERLLLRPPRLADADALYERYGCDPEATRFLSWKTHASVDDTLAFLDLVLNPAPNNRDQHWVLCVAGDASPCGMMTTFGAGRSVALGYVLQRSLWGRGYTTEALRAVAAEVWRTNPTWRLEALAHVENIGSHRVLEKAGLRLEGVLRRRFVMPQLGADPQDCRIYAQVRDDVRG